MADKEILAKKEDSENDLVCDVLELRDLSIGYDDVLISKINAKVEPGETIAILGPSGIGKTTLLVWPVDGPLIIPRFSKESGIGYIPQRLGQ